MLSFLIIIYLSLLDGILGQQELCEDAFSCSGLTLSGEALCYGFHSCVESKFDDVNLVECLGGEACIGSRPIDANDSIICSGFKACTKIRYLNSINSSIKCTGDKSCENGDLTAKRDILCSGHSSCIRSKTETRSLTCLGKKSCQQMSHAGVLSNAQCDGHASCSTSTIVADNIYCRGRQSCEKMKALTVSDTAYGYGYRALSGAAISAKTVDAYGYRSIEQAKLDSGNLKNIEIIINAYGYQASIGSKKGGTDILCRNSSLCTLNCKGDGCDGITLTCSTGALCNISPIECMVNHTDGSISSQFISCPQYIASQSSQQDQLLINGFVTRSDEVQSNLDHPQEIDEMMDEIESQYEQLISETDDEDEIEQLSVYKQMEDEDDSVSKELYNWEECDDALECEGRLFNSSTPEGFCLGYMSCLNAEFDYDGDIQCFGYKACMNATQIYTSGTRSGTSRDTGTAKGFIRCASTKSCYAAGSISAKETVSCLGRQSCANVGLIESRGFNVKCDGSMSCMNSIIESPQKIDCSSYQSCSGSNITTRTITCNGPEACKGTVLTADGAIKCEGMRSCSDSIISAPMYKTYGFYDSINSIIYANNIYGYGYGSLAFSHIRGFANKQTRVFSYGYLSGFGMDYDCDPGATCRLYCKFTGCENIHFNCYYGSKCFVFINDVQFKKPTEFDEYGDNNQTDDEYTIINGTICPKWFQHEEPETELSLDGLIQERKFNRKNDPLYQQIMNEKILSADIYDEEDEMEEMMYDLEFVESVKIDTDEVSLLDAKQSIISNISINAIILTILGIMFLGVIIVSYYKCITIKTQDLKPEYQPLLMEI